MKEKIIQSTVKLISKRGIGAATARNICELAGVKAPTIYHYFDDMRALVDEVVSYAFDKHFRKIVYSDKKNDARKNIEAVWNGYMEFVSEEPDLYAIMMSSVAYGKYPKSAEACFQRLVTSFEILNQNHKLKISPRKAATIYLAAAQGLALIMKNQPEVTNDIGTMTRKLILSGII